MVGPKWQDFNGERLMAGLQCWEPTGRALVAVPQWHGPSGLSLAANPLREQFAGGISVEGPQWQASNVSKSVADPHGVEKKQFD